MAGIKNISERVSYKEHKDFTTIVISPRLSDSKQFMLTFWIFAWTFCGLVFIAQLFFDYGREFKLTIAVISVFWVYYEYRIGYVWMWRRKGFELLKIEDGKLSYKRSIKKFGKSYEFYLDTIRDFKRVENKKQLGAELGNSFWVIGGERLQFNYNNRNVKIGIQLDDNETIKLEKFLKTAIADEKKRFEEKQKEEQVSSDLN